MAQPLFNEHPLQDYLRRSFPLYMPDPPSKLSYFLESGEIFDSMPGAMPDLPDLFSEEYVDDTDTDIDLDLGSWLPTPVSYLVQVSRSRFSPSPSGAFCWQIGSSLSKPSRGVSQQYWRLHRPSLEPQKSPYGRWGLFLLLSSSLTTAMPMFTILNVSIFQLFNLSVSSAQNYHSTLREFSEKFQYDVISSSLLSTSITAPSSTRRRSSSSTGDSPPDVPSRKSRTKSSRRKSSQPVEHRGVLWSLTLFCLLCISLSFDLLCFLIGTTLCYIESRIVHPGNLPDFIKPVGP